MASSTIKQKVVTSLFFAAAIFYLCFHTVHGEQGLYALVVESYKREKLQDKLYKLKEKRIFMEHKVALLRDGSIDPDLLDEESRRVLGVVGEKEVVVLHNR